jgi:hypothetical protein
MNRATRFLPGRRLRAAVGVSAVLLLASACASAPPAPVVPLEAARVAIISAEQADAGRYAGAELSEARQRLAAANAAVAAKDMVAAERFAEQARVEAELAAARTEQAKALAVNREMGRGAEALSEELQRAGDTP